MPVRSACELGRENQLLVGNGADYNITTCKQKGSVRNIPVRHRALNQSISSEITRFGMSGSIVLLAFNPFHLDVTAPHYRCLAVDPPLSRGSSSFPEAGRAVPESNSGGSPTAVKARAKSFSLQYLEI